VEATVAVARETTLQARRPIATAGSPGTRAAAWFAQEELMIRSALSLCVLLATTTANADVVFYNATSETLTVEATSPNGKVDKRKLGDGSEVNASTHFVSLQKLGIRIFDDVGTELWKGTVGTNDVYVTVPDGKGSKTLFAGLYSGSFDTPKASLFMNLTGEPISIDLEGMNGIGAHRGVKPAGFDPKHLVRLDPKESYFTMTVKGGAQEVTLKGNSITPGHYHVITKHPRTTYRILSLGYLAPPAIKK
jgi:hypothetical protein